MCKQFRFSSVAVGLFAWLGLALSMGFAEDKVSKEPAAEKHANSHGHEADAKHGDHGHHDPHDLSHANAGAGLNDLKEFKSDLAIFSFVVFVLLMILLTKFAWKPIMAGLQKREDSIAHMIAEAKHNQEQSESMLKEYQQQLAAAQEETRELISQARREADSLKEKTVAEAQAAAQRERERAVADITAAKNAALHEISQLSVNTAVSLAGRILRKEIRPQDHTAMIRESLEKFPSQN